MSLACRLSLRASIASGILVVLTVLASGCVGGPALLSGVRLSHPQISPSGRGAADATELQYTLGGPARVDLYLDPTSGQRIYLRRDELRPTGGSYLFRFDGSYELPGAFGERRVLADGQYRMVIEARSPSGEVERASVQVQVRRADTETPRLERLEAQPGALTPNFDGRSDVVHVSYRLAKAARVDHYVVDERNVKRWIGPSRRQAPGEYSQTWNALVRGRPVPDGGYWFVVRAEDQAGNVSVARTPIQVTSAGVPEARILSVTFSPRKLIVGELLRVEIRVRNVGEVTLRTQGPDPDYTYSSYDNYFSIEKQALVDKAGRWRVGVDWAGSPGTIGGKYPYRWGFGKDLEPGEEVTVVGYIRVEHRDQRALFGDYPDYHKMWFFAALVQEGVAIHQDHVGGTEIQVSF